MAWVTLPRPSQADSQRLGEAWGRMSEALLTGTGAEVLHPLRIEKQHLERAWGCPRSNQESHLPARSPSAGSGGPSLTSGPLSPPPLPGVSSLQRSALLGVEEQTTKEPPWPVLPRPRQKYVVTDTVSVRTDSATGWRPGGWELPRAGR